MNKIQNLGSFAGLVLLASLAVACGNDKNGAAANGAVNAADAAKADDTCSDSMVAESKKLDAAGRRLRSLDSIEKIRAACAEASAFAEKYAGVRCKFLEADGAVTTINVDKENAETQAYCKEAEARNLGNGS